MLKTTFIELLNNYTDDETHINKLWNEIEKQHSGKKRHYHTLQHLENLLKKLVSVQHKIYNWEAILFAVFYHDIIYKSNKSDNEVKSAELAKKRMNELSVPTLTIEHCIQHILATQSHTVSTNKDTNYFTDADLSVLGQDWKTYSDYCKNVRKEYSIYPDILYKPGRKKVLKHFLKMEKIFKTKEFHNTLETQAKQNIQKELELL